MSRKKNTLSLNISKNKNWNNSWSSYIQEEYKTMFQEGENKYNKFKILQS